MRRLSLLILLAPSLALAWNDTGHMLVARIAESKLTPKAKARVAQLTKVLGDAKTSSFVEFACYADDHKGKDDAAWHYINWHFRTDGKKTSNQPLPENVVWAIQRFSKQLTAGRNDQEKSEALMYLAHFMGDIHQPLHTLARDTDEYPNGDRGGNEFKIGEIDDWSNRPITNLHIAWDFGLGEFRSIPRPLEASGRKQLDQMAAAIMKEFPSTGVKKLSDPQEIALETVSYRDFVYSATEKKPLSQDYLTKGRAICRQRVAAAGYRLADLLNRLLGN